MDYQKKNSETIDRWVEEGWEWGIPITHEEFLSAKRGVWQVLLTPTKPVPHEWFKDFKGAKILGLASGGGQQIPVFAALGGDVTVLDYSKKQLESERAVAEREGYEVEIIRADMTKPLPFKDETFDMVFHPVSDCYVEEVFPIIKECYRILKKGGLFLAGYDNGINFMFDDDSITVSNTFPFNPLKNPEQMKSLIDSDCGVQFSHTLEEVIGGQLKAGFTLLDIYEDIDNEGTLRKYNIPTYYATKSVKK